jgi:uncharacterized protein (DUF779 family)
MTSIRPVSTVKVVLTDAADDALRRVREARSEDLAMVIGNGCCDSTAPFLFAGYVAGPGETEVATVRQVPVLLDRGLLDLFEGREVVIDAGSDDGADSFSCETELGLRFSMKRLPLLG